MSILEGAYWISFRQPRKSLKADADGSVWGVDPGPRGIDVLDSAELRTRIWLAEKATDGQSFRFRNYETGSSLDGNDQSSSDMTRVVVTQGCDEGQLWEISPMNDLTQGTMYQIENVATLTVLGQAETTENRCKIILNTLDSKQREGWLIEPVILPTLYSITNLSHDKLALCTPSYSNPSDRSSGAVKLQAFSLEQPNRNQLWMLEYVSLNEAIVRNASYNRFVLDLASDSQTVLARRCHGGPSQCWTVKYESEETLSLVNTKTGTLLAIQQQEVFKDRRLARLVAIPDGATQWQIQSYLQPPLFWITIQDKSGAYIAQVDDGPLMLYEGPLNINDHTAQWRFTIVGDGLKYVIENRATGFMFGANATADRNDANSHWMLSSTEPGYFQLVNTGSKNLVFGVTGRLGAITVQQAGYQAYDHTSGPSTIIPCHCDWNLKPAYDNLPSFAIVNSYTGRCVANNPMPDVGTVSTANNVNDFRSQWHFRAQNLSNYETVNDLTCVLSSKMSGNSLEVCHKGEVRVEAYNSHRQSSSMDTNSIWRLLPLSTHLFALCMHFGPGFLYDPGNSNSQAQDPPKDIQSLYWYLVSHRELGFDFISMAFSTTEVLKHISSKPSETPWDTIQRYLDAEREPTNGPDSVLKGIPLAASLPLTREATVPVAFAYLIAKWTEDSIPKTSAPHTIISSTREEIERQWGVCLSERALRRSLDQQPWIRIDLQGIYDVGGTWMAGIEGYWLDTPMFRVFIPAETQVSYVVVQRAMLLSLNQGLAFLVRATPSSPEAGPSGNARPDLIRQHESKAFVTPPIEPIEPKAPKSPRNPQHNSSWYSGILSWEYEQYQRNLRDYQNNLEVYNSNLAVYSSKLYWKLRSAEMHFINQRTV